MQEILVIKNAYLKGYERGYREGGFKLSTLEILAIQRFVLQIGYIDYERHADLHELLKRIDAHVRAL